ncbi:MAG TPA: CidA/LrgA family protein [Rhodocyclaceae bacterium]
MLAAITTLLVYQLVGEVISRVLELPVPGPVIGMALLFATLLLRESFAEPLRETAQTLLQHLSLLFVPAGVGIMLHFHRVGAEWLPLAVSLIVSTVLAIAVTALVLQLLARGSQTADREDVS